MHNCVNLKLLNLNHNWLHNTPVSKIIKEIGSSSEIKVLDLSWNCLGDDLIALPSYEHLVNNEINHPDRLFNNFSINEALYTGKLKLRNNPLLPPIDTNGNNKNKNDKKEENKKEVKTEITQEVYKEPKKIKEIPKEPSNFALALCELFEKKQSSLIHLDISYNNLNFFDCKLIAEKIKSLYIRFSCRRKFNGY